MNNGKKESSLCSLLRGVKHVCRNTGKGHHQPQQWQISTEAEQSWITQTTAKAQPHPHQLSRDGRAGGGAGDVSNGGHEWGVGGADMHDHTTTGRAERLADVAGVSDSSTFPLLVGVGVCRPIVAGLLRLRGLVLRSSSGTGGNGFGRGGVGRGGLRLVGSATRGRAATFHSSKGSFS